MMTTKLTERLSRALEFARAAHDGQIRKGTTIPYLAHPMAVASLVLEHGGTEDQAMAAFLHDTIEDCGVTFSQIETKFGTRVSTIVADCTDSSATPKPPWKLRKERYLKHIEHKSRPESLLVSLADKMHNVSAILNDLYCSKPNEVWSRFSAPPIDIVWYYEGLARVFTKRSSEVSESDGFYRLAGIFSERVHTLAAEVRLADAAIPYYVEGWDDFGEVPEGYRLGGFIVKADALEFARACSRLFALRADAGQEDLMKVYESSNPMRCQQLTWDYMCSVTGPDDYASCRDPEALYYPTPEDVVVLKRSSGLAQMSALERLLPFLHVRWKLAGLR